MLFVLLLMCVSTAAQDTITLKGGEDIQAKVLEVGLAEIRYKKNDNQEGPVYTMPRSEVLMIRYENGTKDIFADATIPDYVSVPAASGNTDTYLKGQTDAIRYYRGYKAAGTGTLITALVSPLLGLAPAIACASSPPKRHNLDFPDPSLMSDMNYERGYAAEARRIKRGRVWTNWGIAFGVNLLAVLVLAGQ